MLSPLFILVKLRKRKIRSSTLKAELKTKLRFYTYESILQGYCIFHHMILTLAKEDKQVVQAADNFINEFPDATVKLALPGDNPKNVSRALCILTVSNTELETFLPKAIKELFTE
jgi:hypothetical protein